MNDASPDTALLSEISPANGEASLTPVGRSVTKHVASEALMYLPAVGLGAALAFGTLGLFGRGPKVLRSSPLLSGLLVGGAALGLAKWQLDRFFTESPDYEVEQEVNGLEIRSYPPRVVAETAIESHELEEGLDEGFRRLAGYIFGGNGGARVPGEEAHAKKGERIAMTTPVTAREEATGIVVTFTMPKDRALEVLPIPNDPRIRVSRTEASRFAVLTYRAGYGAARAKAAQEELVARAAAAGLTAAGNPIFAGYDAPSTLPFLRRVEAWLPLA